MGRSAVLSIKILTDATQATKGLGQAEKGVKGFTARVEKAAVPAAAIGLGLAAFGKAAITAASDSQQAMGAVDSVFGASADQIKRWSDQSAESVGLSKTQYGELASVIGAQLRNMGVPLDQVASKTNDLVTMGADLAATFGGTTAESVEALGSALRGETDPIERYGISIKQADIAARQAKDGTAGLEGEAGKAAKTAALLALVTEQAGGAMGQFARETDSAAGASQIAGAQWEDAKAALGVALLPMVVAVAGALADLSGVIQDNTTAFQVVAGVVGTVVLAILAINAALKVQAAVTAVSAAATEFAASTTATWIGVKWLELTAWVRTTAATIANTAATVAQTAVQKTAAAASKAWAAAQWLLNAAMTANPIGLIIAGVLLLVAGIVLLWKNSETFRTIVLAAWAAIQVAGAALLGWLKSAWKAVFNAVAAVVRWFVAGWKANMAVVRAVVAAVTGAVKAAWAAVFGWIRFAVAAVKAQFTSQFNAVRSVVGTVASAVRRAWDAVFGALRRAVSSLGSALAGPFNVVKNAVDAVADAVRNLISWFGRIKVPKISLPSIPGFNATAASVTTAAPVAVGARAATPTARATSGSAGGWVININGAIDPESTARQVRRILAAHDRRMGLSAGLRAGTV